MAKSEPMPQGPQQAKHVASGVSGVGVIVPVYNEGERLLELVGAFLSDAAWQEVIIVDASDDSRSLDSYQQAQSLIPANSHVQLVKASNPGRARQMNHGARLCGTEVYLFLHADTQHPAFASETILGHLIKSQMPSRVWGRFDVRFDSSRWPFRLIAFFMNWRSAVTGICTGDQAIFMHRALFEEVGGFPEIALMEDIEMSRRLKRHSHPVRLKDTVETAARRWQEKGIMRTILLMWGMRLAYWAGVDPKRLAGWYRHVR